MSLPNIYCVYCVEVSAPLALCYECNEAGKMLPGGYSHTERYHCTFCGDELDRYRDFEADGTLKNDAYLCQGCVNTPSYARPYLPEAVVFLSQRLKDQKLPPHIRWTYEQHLQNFNAKNMVS